MALGCFFFPSEISGKKLQKVIRNFEIYIKKCVLEGVLAFDL